MERVPEPELMLDESQVRAYAQADFEEPHNQFIELLGSRLGNPGGSGRALDLGCGHGDISRRFAAAFPGWHVDGVDGSPAMLALAREMTPADAPIRYLEAYLPSAPADRYDLIFSNSLLHHLADPAVLWDTIRASSRPGCRVFVMDLFRPTDLATAEVLKCRYVTDEPDVLQQDFLNSLLAAYEPGEIQAQLERARLGFEVETVSDRHVIAWGRVD